MQREARWTDVSTGKVVHVVGCVTDEVFSFLGPATNALARTGVDQTVVMIDELRYRHHVLSLHESAELMLMPRLRNPVKQWRAVLQGCRHALEGGPLRTVHLHGLLACLVGAIAVRTTGVKVPIFYSPHGSRSLGQLRALGTLMLWLFRPVLRPARHAAIVNVPQEKMALDQWKSVELVESPVNDAFFNKPRNEARHPLLVTGGRGQGARSAELFAQLAVLLSGEDLHISFNWIGTVDPVSHVRLNAASVGVFERTSDDDCAQRLAAGWIYVALGGTRGFPLFLVEAMAAGLPCVAMDSAQHREVIRDGETGFLCGTERDMIARIATLIDNPSLRAHIGQAAREEAKPRFGRSKFNARLLAAYALLQ
ncbi:MAG: glycosyltransferase [Burkholderiales bacterium]|jgi:glycosyltransferase involved in cell wall biosynthesis|nr:glycosyltransferase [Burkholderiales bacterium]